MIREALRDAGQGVGELRALWQQALNDPRPGVATDEVLDRLERGCQADGRRRRTRRADARRVSPPARGERLADYIALGSFAARGEFRARDPAASAQWLGKNPLLYRPRSEIGPEARLVAVGRYVILFRLLGKVVRIERVAHGSRDLQQLLTSDDKG